MKNGVNVAGVSELMHEIRGDSTEGVFAYDAEAQWTGGDTLIAFVNPALIGSVKSARGFFWRVTLSDEAPVSAVCQRETVFTPEELALTGLGSCALLTMVKGATTRGRTIESLRFLVRGKHYLKTESQAACLSDFDYRVEFAAEAEEDTLLFTEVLKKLANHSPNHRTIVERNTLTVGGPQNLSFDSLEPVNLDVKHRELSVDIQWDYGFQLFAYYPDGVRHNRIDQPKQGGGIDRGANPQEVLMSAFVSCLTRTLIEIASESNVALNGVKVRASGHVDMRGMLGIDPKIPSKLQDITLNIDADCEASDSQMRELIQGAVYRSPVARLLIEPQAVHLHLFRDKQLITEFLSQG